MARLMLVAGARGVLDPTAISDEDDVAVPAVGLVDYLAGVLLDGDQARRAARRGFMDDVLATVPVKDYTLSVPERTRRSRLT